MPTRILLITGLPGAGKTTLARQVARRYSVALIGKDAIKEPLLDTLLESTGADDAARSRRLSDASFAVMFSLARELAAAGADLILEGNFRRGEHELPLRKLFSTRMAQVLCSVDENIRQARLMDRQKDPSRHPGHRDAARIDRRVAADCVLDLPEQCTLVVHERDRDGMERIDRWWECQ